ncbi:hypothetical protein CC85DRAFT_164715 [Cutaneotrichosporon oleaginosum]|uniref:Uncharacterized protein n=1 Tax=Cutaneotrichosporon oleaginosum TaxID=879819 RepID=A0A0J0XGE7_9TREE|nr:uncharacterized protein CC85DRAFT_164715 [Cutaneotrichosporon oleaginosum]KLT40097.1 hypothetical protein CC85DRAFT_164715 [Cutaneotrichosporon oleaginosum]TXT10430.1 hypothetical protein COLE_04364 [Cutaneotrichosporon oleaginosum]
MAENPPARHDRDVRAAVPEAGPAEAHNRLGGAAIRRGNAQYIFRPNQPPEVRYPERDGGRPRGDEEGALPLPPGLDRLFGGMRRNPAIIRNLLTGAFYLGGAGPALQLDAKAILETVKAETPAASADGFTHTWDPEDLAKEVEEKEKRAVVVELDERGRIVPDKRKQRGQVYLACCACPEPLRVGSANRSPDDRVWALRCGHVLDQRCYKLFSEPAGAPPIPVLDAPPAKRRRSGRTTRARAGKVQHQWACPVKGCGFTHVSEMVDDVWAPLEGLGGMQLYV